MLRLAAITQVGVIQFVLLLTQVKSEQQRQYASPVQGRIFFAIAAPPSAQSYIRVFNRTLSNITQGYMVNGHTFNLTLDTIAIDLPENGSFSATLLESVCGKLEGRRVVAVLVVGHSPAAFTVSMTAKHAGIPVLWAKGRSGFLPGFKSLDSNPLEIYLSPSGGELVQALRGLLLQAHWHTFTVLADRASATALRGAELWRVL
ncbi:unnamed protein product, partial [Callosobruchus maculatus]